MALNRKIAYIDLSTGKIDIKPIPLEVRRKFLGGRDSMPISFIITQNRGATLSALTTPLW